MSKYLSISAGYEDQQLFASLLAAYIDRHYPPGSADVSLDAREALLTVLQALDEALATHQPTFALNKRLRVFCKLALDEALPEQVSDPAALQRLRKALG